MTSDGAAMGGHSAYLLCARAIVRISVQNQKPPIFDVIFNIDHGITILGALKPGFHPLKVPYRSITPLGPCRYAFWCREPIGIDLDTAWALTPRN